MKAGVGISQHTNNSLAAGTEAALMAMKSIAEASLTIVFASSRFHHEEVIQGIRRVTKTGIIIGGSSAGEISHHALSTEGTVVVMCIHAPNLSFFPAISDDIHKIGSHNAGKNIASQIQESAQKAGKRLSFSMIFPDILAGNGADIVRGMLDVLGVEFPIIGGATGDDQKFVRTYQYLNDKVYTNRIAGIGVSGDVKVSVGVSHGWVPIGTTMTVTKSINSRVYEINGEPAINTFIEYFGQENVDLIKGTDDIRNARALLTYPLGIIRDDGTALIRMALNIHPDGSIDYAAEIPNDSTVRIMFGSPEETIQAAKDSAQKCLDRLGESPKALLVFNCIGRKNLYGNEANKEIQAITEVFGKDVPLIGFYTYGEQAPVGGITKHMQNCENSFHNQTIVICALA